VQSSGSGVRDDLDVAEEQVGVAGLPAPLGLVDPAGLDLGPPDDREGVYTEQRAREVLAAIRNVMPMITPISEKNDFSFCAQICWSASRIPSQNLIAR
jgi:hypothetical protein